MEHKIELLNKTIEEQNELIFNYKTKLKDLVQAYKNLGQEKAALEASIAALKSLHNLSKDDASESREKFDSSNVEDAQNNPEKEGGAIEESEAETLDGSDRKEVLSEARDQSSKEQVDILTSSLLTVTQQKARLESSCLAERKQFRADLDKKNDEIENLKRLVSQMEGESKEWRSKLRTQQLEHDKQQNDCVLMVKELQSLLNSERMIKEQLHSQMEDMKVETEEKKKAVSAHVAALTNRELSVREEFNATRESLKEALLKLSQPSPEIALLERQIKEAKEAEESLRGSEGRKLEEAEQKIAEISKVTEMRVCTLEEKILRLSEMLGSSEKGKVGDQAAIQKLRDRCQWLEEENKTLVALTESQKGNTFENLTPQEMMVKLRSMVAILISNGQDLSPIYDEINCGEELHGNCRAQLHQLQEEFERYKLRAQSVLKNKSKDSSSDAEANLMKKQVSELKEKISHLKSDIQSKESDLRIKDESHMKITLSLIEKHKSEVNHLNTDWQQKLSSLEAEMRKQRERTISMLAEKEQEISELKFYSTATSGLRSPRTTNESAVPKNDVAFDHQTMFASPSLLPDDNVIGASSALVEEDGETLKQDSSSNAIKHLLSRRPEAVLLGKEAGNLLHFVQERARLEMDLSLMRKHKNAAEAATREVQYLLALRDDEHDLETNALKESLRKLERDVGRESANLEYLKNVVYQYIMCRDGSSRQQMFNAISIILQFSPYEKQTVLARKGWRI